MYEHRRIRAPSHNGRQSIEFRFKFLRSFIVPTDFISKLRFSFIYFLSRFSISTVLLTLLVTHEAEGNESMNCIIFLNDIINIVLRQGQKKKIYTDSDPIRKLLVL